MNKFSNILNENDDNKEVENTVDPNLLLKVFKKFDYSDLITYFKGLMIKYLDVYTYQKIELESYKDYMFAYSKIEKSLSKTEKDKIDEIKKIIMKYYENI